MCGKKPKAVVTDGDLVMLNAIKEVFPETVNRRCAWHIRKNLKSLHFKKEVIDYWYRCYRNYDETMFEEKWKGFSKNTRWKTTSKSVICMKRGPNGLTLPCGTCIWPGRKTTSRIEGLNSQIKTYLSNRHTLFEFFF
ncbi:hypothetical protein LINGRAHAP2_LOCUS29052 [Linum grandiflorum]